jgi:serine protease Do
MHYTGRLPLLSAPKALARDPWRAILAATVRCAWSAEPEVETAMPNSVTRAFSPLVAVEICACLLLFATSAAPAGAAETDSPRPKSAVTADAAGDRFFDAIVKVTVHAIPGARSSSTLGAEREGTGIVIGDNGLILTIGYLIVEADDVQVIDHRGRALPARVVGYDHATGLGLVRAVVPLDAPPMALGDSGKLAERDPVMIVNYSGEGDVTLAFVVSKRPFTGSWEYLLDTAIFTSPPTANWSGAALVGRDLKLLGVGSLIVREATDDEGGLPGNMFVPIDSLKPILADLVKDGHRAGPAQPWLGVAADEVQGRLVVARVSPEGPADKAGLRAGDIILGVGGDGVRTQAEFYRKVWSRGAAGADIPLRVLQGIDVHEVTVHSIDRVDYFRPRTTY